MALIEQLERNALERMRYRILDGGRAIQCLTCGLVSHNAHDVEQLYCGACHKFHVGAVHA